MNGNIYKAYRGKLSGKDDAEDKNKVRKFLKNIGASTSQHKKTTTYREYTISSLKTRSASSRTTTCVKTWICGIWFVVGGVNETVL